MPFHGKRPELGDLDTEPLGGHFKEPPARSGADAAHREGPGDPVHHRDRLVVHAADIDHGCRPVLAVCEVDRPLRVDGQFFLDEVCFDLLSHEEPAVSRGADRLDILPGEPCFGKGVGDHVLCTLQDLGRRLPAGADDLVVLHDDRLCCCGTRVKAKGDALLDPPGQAGHAGGRSW